MAYITTHNCHKIVTRNNLKDVTIEGEVYKKIINFFSTYEENCLLAIQELMKNPEKYFKDVYNPIIAKDSKKYIFKENQPAFHTNINCEMLNSNFSNFELPTEIIERGDAEIEKFREWFKQNSSLLETPDIFVMRLQLAFNITYNPQAINYENSGHTDFKNYTVQELEQKIDNLLSEARGYYLSNKKNTAILKIFSKYSSIAFTETHLYNNNTGYSDLEVKKTLKEFHLRFKLPTKKALIEYYRIKLNPDLQFAENFLEALGFKKCQTCEREHKLTLQKFKRDIYNIDKLIKNPELLKKLDLIDKIANSSK